MRLIGRRYKIPINIKKGLKIIGDGKDYNTYRFNYLSNVLNREDDNYESLRRSQS